jgi:hypothetical protein
MTLAEDTLPNVPKLLLRLASVTEKGRLPTKILVLNMSLSWSQDASIAMRACEPEVREVESVRELLRRVVVSKTGDSACRSAATLG